VTQAFPGDLVHGTLHGAPHSLQLVLMAGGTGYVDFRSRPGWGAVALDAADPWLNAILGAFDPNLVLLDATGRWDGDYLLPTQTVWGIGFGGEEGWSFQMVDLGTMELSAPFRIEKL